MRLNTFNREIVLFQIDNVPDCKTYNAMCFGHQLEHAFKIRQFCETAKSVWLSQKHKHYKTAISEAKKLYNVRQFYCRFHADKKRCFDDSFQFFYTTADTPQTPLEWSALWSAMQANYDAKSEEWTLTTEHMFHEMLGVVPPVAMRHGAFLVGEPKTHDANGRGAYAAFRQLPGNVFQAKYMTANEFRSV